MHLITIKAGNGANRLAATAPSVLWDRKISSRSRITSIGIRIRLGVVVFPFEMVCSLVVVVGRRRGVIDETPGLQEIEDPAYRSNVTDDGLASLGEGDLAGRTRIISEATDDGVPVVLVNPRVLGGRPTVEKFGEETNLAFVNFLPRKPPYQTNINTKTNKYKEMILQLLE